MRKRYVISGDLGPSWRGGGVRKLYRLLKSWPFPASSKAGVFYGLSLSGGIGPANSIFRRHFEWATACLLVGITWEFSQLCWLINAGYMRCYQIGGVNMSVPTTNSIIPRWSCFITAGFTCAAILTKYGEWLFWRFPSSPFWPLCNFHCCSCGVCA